MQLRSLLAALVLTVAALPLQAQIRDVRLPARFWVTPFAGMYTTVDNVYDPETDSAWLFDDQAFGFGLGVEREVTPGLLIGLEGSYASTDFERRASNVLVADGTANLITGLATGRLISGGGGGINFYLKGGIGVFGYRVPDPEQTNLDFALASGAGVEYRFQPRLGALLEWTQFWAYHEKDGLDQNNTGRHSLLRLGIRAGL